MKNRKQLFALLLAVLIYTAALPLPVMADTGTKLVALTFDDGPGPYTEKLLDGLKKRGVHVTFFMTGENAELRPATVRRAWEEGHQVCNHSYSHAQLTTLSISGIKDQIRSTNKILNGAIGYDLKYSVRPPYGSYNELVLNTVGVPCYYWSVDTLDWQSKNTNAAYRAVMKDVKDGSIILMHDIHKTTIPAALRAIDKLKAKGYEFVTLNEMLVRRGITPTAGNIYFYAYPDEHGTDAALSKPVIEYKQTFNGKRVFINGDERARIYYTVSGEAPTPGNSTLYTDSFPISEDTEVQAVCVYDWNGFKTEAVVRHINAASSATLSIHAKNGRIIISGISGDDDAVIPNVTMLVFLIALAVALTFIVFAAIGVLSRRKKLTTAKK